MRKVFYCNIHVDIIIYELYNVITGVKTPIKTLCFGGNMNISKKIQILVISALLCAVGILIPIVMPLKIIIEPMSFTFASHVAIFIAMFISPAVCVFVTIGTTLGFFLAGFSPFVVLRALSHIVFAIIGSTILKKHPDLLSNKSKSLFFNFVLGVIHGVCEVLAVIPFYFTNALPEAFYANNFLYTMILLVGVGTILHSMVDYYISILIWYPLKKSKVIKIMN